MLMTTQDVFEDYEIVETLGAVRGNVVGGEILEYTKLIAESREQAIDRMVKNAEELGADGIVCMRFTTSAIMSGAAELLAYGTAVKLKKRA